MPDPLPGQSPIDQAILASLRVSFVHILASDLAVRAGCSREVVAARIAELRGAGYLIDENPLLGYRLTGAPDRLIADDLLIGIQGNRFIKEVMVFEETSSTNDIASRLGRTTGKNGLAIFAEKQTAGRGRLGRRWESSSHQGLWFSVLLRPPLPLEQWARLTAGSAVAIARAVEAVTGREAGVKWPNDVLVDGRKVCGILSECYASGLAENFVVAGVGLNVNHETSDFPEELREIAGSLRQFAGRRLDRQQVAIAVLRELDRAFGQILADFETIVAEARRRSVLLGKSVRVTIGAEVIDGIAEDLAPDGGLLIRGVDGQRHVVNAGEVTQVRPV